MTAEDWQDAKVLSLGIQLFGDAMDEPDAQGRRIEDDTFLLLLNAHHEPVVFKLPSLDGSWERVIDTSIGQAQNGATESSIQLESRSLLLLRESKDAGA